MSKRLLDISKIKKVSVLGMGKSGLEVAQFFSGKGIDVFISDSAEEDKLEKAISFLKDLGVLYETGGHSDKLWKDVDLVVISPGISFNLPVVKNLREKGLQVISELELAFQLSRSPFIAITGTNGKSTTTSLIGSFLSSGGFDVIVGGNIGIPLVQKAYEADEKQIIVAEVSSFQLETVEHFRPYISLILNISSDHLDRHGTMDNYLDFKSRIFMNQSEEDYTILNYDDPLVRSRAGKVNGNILFFSLSTPLERGIFLNNDRIYYRNNSHSMEISLSDIPLKGKHNLQNVMAAMIPSFIYGVSDMPILKALKEFKGLKHRQEFVDEIKGVKFIDDSKGTNPDAVIAALEICDGPLVLIAGGVDKDMDFSEMCKVIAKRVKGLVLIGKTSNVLGDLCKKEGLVDIFYAPSIEEAVQKAFSIFDSGGTVLLSPAGASFDMFKNAEDRGEKFVQAVYQLKNKPEE